MISALWGPANDIASAFWIFFRFRQRGKLLAAVPAVWSIVRYKAGPAGYV